MVEIVLFGAIAVFLLLVAGGAFSEKAYWGGAIASIFGAIFVIITALSLGVYSGPLGDLDGKTFAVDAKIIDSTGKKVYILYDLEKKKNRLALLPTYPPAGYQEAVMTDGKVLLTPSP